MNFKNLFFVLTFLALFPIKAYSEEITLCPVCSMNGEVICPESFKPNCTGEGSQNTVPKCFFVQNSFIPGCYRYERDEKINFNLTNLPSEKLMIIGDTKVYSLNSMIIGCVRNQD